jgi:methionyl-tRNA formyltransferase
LASIGVAATAPFGADVLERLATLHDVEFVLTRPDAPAGRGRKTSAPAAKTAARRLGLPVLQPERLDERVELPTETIVAVAYGLLVPRELLERHRWLNLHPSLLPRWRGAAPVERAIMAGDSQSGVTVIELVEALDAGPIAAQEAFPIGLDDDAGAIFDRAAEAAARLLAELPVATVPQPEAGVTYAEKISAADRDLDWARPPRELHDRIRALSPHIGARAELNGRRVVVWRSRLVDDHLEVLEVQPEGKRRMSYDEFLRGLR